MCAVPAALPDTDDAPPPHPLTRLPPPHVLLPDICVRDDSGQYCGVWDYEMSLNGAFANGG